MGAGGKPFQVIPPTFGEIADGQVDQLFGGVLGQE
jgi:hypothetical protein